MRWRPTTDEPFHVEHSHLCSFDDDEPSGQAVSTVTNDPWSGQQPYLTSGFSRAEQLFNRPREYYPGSTVVPWAPETTEAMEGLSDFAAGGLPAIGAARDEALATISGDYLTRENPYYTEMADRVSGDVMNRVGTAFGSTVGGIGSPAHLEAVSRGITEGLAPLQYGTMQQERGNQLSLLPRAAQIELMGTTAPSVLGQIGAAKEAQAGTELSEDIARWDFEQQEPIQRLREYMTAIGGGQYGGTTTSRNPVYSNPWATGLGLASTAAGIGGSLFGSGGIWPQGAGFPI